MICEVQELRRQGDAGAVPYRPTRATLIGLTIGGGGGGRARGLVAAAGRSRAQVMAIDLREGRTTRPVGGSAVRGFEAPMTEAQIAVLTRRGMVPETDLTWVEASLLIDQATGAARGQQAMTWLRENGASVEEAAQVMERAEQALRTPRTGRQAAGDRRFSGGRAAERDAPRSRQSDAARDRQRQRRRAWAGQSRSAENTSHRAVNSGSSPDVASTLHADREGRRPGPRASR